MADHYTYTYTDAAWVASRSRYGTVAALCRALERGGALGSVSDVRPPLAAGRESLLLVSPEEWLHLARRARTYGARIENCRGTDSDGRPGLVVISDGDGSRCEVRLERSAAMLVEHRQALLARGMCP